MHLPLFSWHNILIFNNILIFVKKIVVSDHAKERIKKYGFEEVFVVEIIEQPDEVVDGYGGRKIAQKKLNDYILRIVYEEYENELLVITVYPAEKERY